MILHNGKNQLKFKISLSLYSKEIKEDGISVSLCKMKKNLRLLRTYGSSWWSIAQSEWSSQCPCPWRSCSCSGFRCSGFQRPQYWLNWWIFKRKEIKISVLPKKDSFWQGLTAGDQASQHNATKESDSHAEHFQLIRITEKGKTEEDWNRKCFEMQTVLTLYRHNQTGNLFISNKVPCDAFLYFLHKSTLPFAKMRHCFQCHSLFFLTIIFSFHFITKL